MVEMSATTRLVRTASHFTPRTLLSSPEIDGTKARPSTLFELEPGLVQVLGGKLVTQLTWYGYSRSLSLGCIASAGSFAAMIPPSITMVIYAIICEQSVGKLLIAGVVPGQFDRPAGCLFSPRCTLATELCRTVQPPRIMGALCHYALKDGVPQGHPRLKEHAA